MAVRKKTGKKMLKEITKPGRGRPRKEDANTTIVSVALSSSDVEHLEAMKDEEQSRSEVARELIREGFARRATPEDLARERVLWLEGIRKLLDDHVAPAGREDAIAKLLAGRRITEAEARELAKPTRKR